MFGGPAWTRVPDGQWYLHLFAAEQPDLNWENREVRDDFLTTLRFWSDRGVDGFRVDVAHGLAKNLAEPLASLPVGGDLTDGPLPPGTHPLWDRDEVHDIYAEWRQVFNEYDPPRAGVAEAWVHPSRRPKYASPDGLGQAFNFDLLEANWKRRRVPAGHHRQPLRRTAAGIVHDVGAVQPRRGTARDPLRAAARGTPQQHQERQGLAAERRYLPRLDRGLGLRRARAAILMMLALPGSAYLYQGEELGLHEVPDIPAELLRIPPTRGPAERRRAATAAGSRCRGRPAARRSGSGTGAAHLPQPAWFGPLSVQAQERDPASTLTLYRHALSWRRKLQTAETMEWMPGTNGQVLHFARPGGWRCVTNFGPGPVPLPHGTVIVTSAPSRTASCPPTPPPGSSPAGLSWAAGEDEAAAGFSAC